MPNLHLFPRMYKHYRKKSLIKRTCLPYLLTHRNFRLWNHKNHAGRTVPFRILERVMLHQIPVSPSAGKVVSQYAKGMRAPVSKMPVNAGGTVRPVPLNAPAVTDSVTINTCERARIFR